MLPVIQKHKLVLADRMYVSVPPALRVHKMALVGNELFSIQDILLISKIIISLVRVLQGARYFGVCLPCLEVPAAGFIGFFVSSFVVSSNRACLL